VTTRHRTAIAAYVAAERHLREGGGAAKSLSQMAEEIGTTKTTVRRWLRRDHGALWLQHWPSVNELWEAAQRDRARLPCEHSRAHELLAELRQDALRADYIVHCWS
jgi:hypothetical protein